MSSMCIEIEAADWKKSYHYPASDILDGPKVEGEQEGDGDENANEGRREVSAENVDKKRSHPEDLSEAKHIEIVGAQHEIGRVM